MEDGGIVGLCVLAQDGGHVLDIVLDEGGVGGIDLGELVKVLLDVALAAKHGKELCVAVLSSGKEGGGGAGVLVGLEGVDGAEEDEGSEECVDDGIAGILCEVASDGVDVVSFEVFSDEEQEDGLEHRDKLQRRVVLELLFLSIAWILIR